MSNSLGLINCRPPGSSVSGISQARMLEWVAISFSRGSSQPRDRTCVSWVSCIGRWVLHHYGSLFNIHQYPISLSNCPITRFLIYSIYHNWLIVSLSLFQFVIVLFKKKKNFLKFSGLRQVHPKGDQPWVFIGRTDAETETPILWPPYVKSWLTGKDPDAGRGWGQEEKGTTEDEMAGWHHWLDGYGLG